MSEEFKEKLRKYSEGTLPEEEREELESELAKLEAYQLYLEEQMEREEQEEQANGQGTRMDRAKGTASGMSGLQEDKKNKKKAKKIIRRGKWKARITNTFTVFSVFLIFTVISSIITAVFYSTGSRGETYKDVVTSAIAVTRPNTTVRLSSNAHYFFRLELTGNLLKQVGSESIQVGSYTQNLHLGMANLGEFNWMDERNAGNSGFYYPSAKGSASRGGVDSDQWAKLEKLPEGTVAEAYLSLDHLYTTDELLKQLEPLNLLPVWFGADTGPSTRDDVVRYPLGFPYQPIWHKDDMKKSEVSTTKTGWFSSVSSYSSVSPSVEAYGSGALRDENFIKTLKLLQQHQSLASKVVYIDQLDASLAYLQQNGVKLYGAVVTGPVKELLKLREAPWVSYLQVGEVRLWNWQE